MNFMYAALGIFAVWLGVMTFFVLRMMRHYRSLTQRTGDGSIDTILSALMKQNGIIDKHMGELQRTVSELETARHTYFQKYGFVKFNPFNDRVAGDQSFVIALLDNKNNGLVQTFLYTRDGVRVYVKPITSGKAEFELSHEEEEAIKKAS